MFCLRLDKTVLKPNTTPLWSIIKKVPSHLRVVVFNRNLNMNQSLTIVLEETVNLEDGGNKYYKCSLVDATRSTHLLLWWWPPWPCCELHRPWWYTQPQSLSRLSPEADLRQWPPERLRDTDRIGDREKEVEIKEVEKKGWVQVEIMALLYCCAVRQPTL